MLTSLGKTHGRVSVLAESQTLRMNPSGAVFLKFVTGKPTAELAQQASRFTRRLSRTRLPHTTV
nr:hypothetical protein [uncultured Limnobacter sp.]